MEARGTIVGRRPQTNERVQARVERALEEEAVNWRRDRMADIFVCSGDGWVKKELPAKSVIQRDSVVWLQPSILTNNTRDCGGVGMGSPSFVLLVPQHHCAGMHFVTESSHLQLDNDWDLYQRLTSASRRSDLGSEFLSGTSESNPRTAHKALPHVRFKLRSVGPVCRHLECLTRFSYS